ncbi:MAG: ABC transporter substrate-binding protein [Microvirga sp.]|jgi:putative ABC transport system substrate-binding protein
MRRRAFIAAMAGAAAWPGAARAQQQAVPVIGFLGSSSPDLYTLRLGAFRQGLKEEGYVEGQNVAVEYRWADGQNDRLPALAAELTRRQVTVIAAGGGTPAALAAKTATTTIPIVFGIASDPVNLGLVAGLDKPKGNSTGVVDLGVEIGPKRLELLREMVPAATAIGVLVNPTSPDIAERFSRTLEEAGTKLGLQVVALQASTDRELQMAVATFAQLKGGALEISPDNFFTSRSEQLAALTVRYAVPAIYHSRRFAEAGGLVSYGTSETEYYRLIGNYTGKILAGEKPSDLPVQQLAKVELIINLKTAKALGLTVPLALLGRADEVIE